MPRNGSSVADRLLQDDVGRVLVARVFGEARQPDEERGRSEDVAQALRTGGATECEPRNHHDEGSPHGNTARPLGCCRVANDPAAH